MNNLEIKHVFFDLDHTLWDFDKNSALTFEKIFKINNVAIDLKSFLKYYEPINLDYWRLFRNNKIEKKALRYSRLKDTFNAINVEVTDTLIDTLSEDYITHLSSFNHLFEDTLDTLDYLKSKYTLHIITNGFHEVQQKKLKNSKIAHYFETVTDSEIVGEKKPNPKIFQHALDIANATAQESIMIGDSLEADTLGALNHGLQAIWYNYNFSPSESNILEVNSLKELKTHL
jgi:putative hydrolase of the HAD superfamily